MKFRPSWGIKARLFVVAWVMGILPLALSSVFSYSNTTRALTDQAKAELRTVPQTAGKRIETFLYYRLKAAQLYAATPEVLSGSAKQRIAYFEKILELYPLYLWIGATDREGRIVAATDPRSLGQDVAHRAWFRECKATLRAGVFDAYSHLSGERAVSTAQDRPHIGFTVPIRDSSGRFLGALHADVKMEIVARHIEGAHLGESGQVLLVGPRGEVIADVFGPRPSPWTDAHSLSSYRLARAGRTGVVREKDLAGRDSFISFAPVGGAAASLGWSVLAVQATDEVFAASRSQLKLSALMLLLGTVFILVGSYFLLGRGIAVPIGAMMDGVKAVSRGDFRRRVEVRRRDELGRLAEAFNDMMAAIEEKSRDLRAKNEELDGYIGAISHDLRSPLYSLQGFSRLLEEECQTALGDAGSRYLQRIRANVRQMEDLVETLLELSEAGRASRALTWESPADILEGVREELGFALEQNQVRLIVREGLPPIHGDRKSVRQVFVNLIGNAIFAVKGVPSPTVEVGAVENGSGSHPFFVRDNGRGIDPIYHRRIFEPFQSFCFSDEKGKPQDRKGLGLAIVKRIVQAHGGEIWVESQLGSGACFYFTFPEGNDQGSHG